MYAKNLFLKSKTLEMADMYRFNEKPTRVKSGNLGHQVNSDSDLVCFIFQLLECKNKLTKQTVKILMRRLVRSCLVWISSVCKCMSEFTWCPKLPDFTLGRKPARK